MSIKINYMLKKYTLLFFLFFVYTAYSQDTVSYRFDVFGSAGSGKYTPFWITSNTYGMVPIKQNSGYVRGDLFWRHSFPNEIKIEAEVDIVTAAKHSSQIWVHQLYAAVSYRNIYFFIGSKERYNSLLDRNLCMGDMTFSTNARPIPEVNFSFPDYTKVPFTKDYLQFKADFALGKHFDNNYILRTKNPDSYYNLDVLLHHKSLFFKLEDPAESFPFYGIIGLEHAAQWGGWTSLYDFGNNPSSFKDLIRIILCQNGDSRAIDGDQVNVLGNHLGTYNFKVGYKHKKFLSALYKQHFFDDNSGLEFANWRDGIWGGEFTFLNQPYLKKIVLEYLQTTNQSGPIHFLYYDGVLYPNSRGGGNDNYYNNFAYFSGWTYFGRGIGNALLTSPEYNEDNDLCFKNNRIKAIHLGLEGKIASEFSYRTLFTGAYGWGTNDKPFIKRKENFYSSIECIYKPEKLKGWQIALQTSFDQGDMYGNNIGGAIKISKTGIIGK